LKGRVPGRGVRLSAPGGAQGWALSAETDGCLQKIVRAVGVAAFWDLGDGGSCPHGAREKNSVQ